MEDVRASNFAYSQTKISEYLVFYFAALGVGSSVVASEIQNYHNEEDVNKEWIIICQSISNISTAFLSKQFHFTYTLYSRINMGELSFIHTMAKI